jgi:hypothetical protein
MEGTVTITLSEYNKLLKYKEVDCIKKLEAENLKLWKEMIEYKFKADMLEQQAKRKWF